MKNFVKKNHQLKEAIKKAGSKTQLKTIVLLVLLAFTLINCTKSNDPQDQLPPITQTGANTFGCIINGEVLIPKDGIGVPQPKGLFVGHYSNNNLVIDAGNLSDSGGDNIYMYIYNLTSTGTYTFGLSTGQGTSTFEPAYNHIFCYPFDGQNPVDVYLSDTNSGTITITRFDPANFIVSGTFELTVFNKDNPNETIEITEGRFDIDWSTI